MSEEKSEVVEKTVIRPDTTDYVNARSASGAKSKHNGDAVACALSGATLDEVYALTAEATDKNQSEYHERYAHLNLGQQRMNLGNRIRGAVNKMNKEKEGTGDEWITDLSSGVQEAIEKRVKTAAAEKKAKEVAAAKAKAEKEKAATKAAAEKAKAAQKAEKKAA